MPAEILESPDEELSALSIWTFTLGIFALLTFGLTSLPSVICGHVALARSKNSNGRSLGRCVTLVGLVIGYAGTALFGTSIVAVVRFLASP
jgi:hypothetical protein